MRFENGKGYPLSFAQNRLWFFEQLHPGTAVYNVPSAFRIKGSLNIKALEWSLSEVVRRHYSLRTVFRTQDGIPYQQISDPYPVRIEIENLEDHSEESVEARLTQDACRSFDLEEGPLLRAHLYSLGKEQFVFMIVLHHIVSDGWSMSVLFREVSALYDAYVKDQSSPLIDLDKQYIHYAEWQRDRLQGDLLESHLSYWKNQIGKEPPVLNLPYDKRRPSVFTYRGKTETEFYPASMLTDLVRFSHENRVTLYMTLSAIVHVLLAKYSGQKEILTGTLVAGRVAEFTEDLIGFFVNTLMIRSEIDTGHSFTTFLKQIRKTTLAALDHQELPFEMLVEKLQPARSLSHTPFFQVLATLQNMPRSPLVLPGATVEPDAYQHTGTTKFDWTISFTEKNSRLQQRFIYSADLFEAESIQRAIRHFQILTASILANPDEKISNLRILDDEERKRIVVGFNQTQHEFPRTQSVIDLFEEQVRKSPDAIALEYENTTLTYEQLNQRASRIAKELALWEVQPESPIGICIDRTPEMVIAMLAILKAAAAYVPLDPRSPANRIEALVKNASTDVVVTSRQYASRLPPCVRTILIDEVLESTGSPSGVVETAVNPEALAYIMYTSGSTGEPKGVGVPHRAIVNLVCNTNYVVLGPEDRIAQIAHSSFDATTFEIWGALLNGARIVIIPYETVLSPEALGESIQQKKITAMFMTAALFHLMARENPDSLTSLHSLLVGGEEMNPVIAGEFLSRTGFRGLANNYGPTETTTFASWHPVELKDCSGNIPIGCPISNVKIYILDENRQIVPVGVAGEIYIGGEGVAKGYYNQPELTQQFFLPDPFSENPSVLFYKTGDLGRWRGDGKIEFLGRVDEQVKIRGFRIEPGEVERAIALLPQIKECAVIAKETDGEKTLTAVLVPSNGSANLIPEVCNFLKQKLPDFMIPARYAILDALPKTDHNKVDRRILANMSFDRDLVQKTDRPRDSYEATLIRVWKKLLHVEEIGVRDNFFALGGHSLLVIRLFSQIEEHFQKTLPISTIFDHPTIEELAAHIQKTEASLSESLIIPDKPAGSRTPFFFLAGPNALSLARYLDAEQPLYSIQIHKVVGKYSRMESLAQACIQEMRTIQPEGPYYIGGFCLLSHLVLEIITQLKSSSAEIATVILVDAPSPINFQQSQSMRASLMRVWNALLKKSHSNKPAYLFQKIKDMMHGRWRRAIQFRLQKLTDSPPKGALGDGWEYYQQIARIYKPPKYTGNIHLILQRTAKVRFDLEWQRLASSVNVHWISKAPDHRSIFKEPYISEVASSITSLLENAGLEHSNEAHEQTNAGFEGGITTTLNNG